MWNLIDIHHGIPFDSYHAVPEGMRVDPLLPAKSDRARDRLNCPGGTPNSRLNARLNAASESYPTSEATCITAARVVCSILAASCYRQRAR